MELFNTESKKTEAVKPHDGKELKFYCCGPTVYAAAHVGNFRTFTVQDVLRRVLEHTGKQEGWTVKHVRNLTDVDDKTIQQAITEKKPLKEVTEFWTRKFHADANALGLLRPHVEPKATDYIGEQIALVQQLQAKGLAYVGTDNSVYYDVSKAPFPQGRLSRIIPAEARRTVSKVQKVTRNPDDFVLWKAEKPSDGGIAWDSPLGRGRPGWHLECSAMSQATLGETLDLHGGGVDLKFPHHENEILQSEGATGKCFCHHWAHSEHLLINNEKMAKSEGNAFTLDGLRTMGWTPVVVRYALLAAHYRKQLDLNHEGLLAAKHAVSQLQRFQAKLPPADPLSQVPTPLFEPVMAALANDMNTPEALGQLFLMMQRPVGDAQEMANGFAYVTKGLLGVDLSQSVEPPVPVEVRKLADERWAAKQAKDFARADGLRKMLLSQSYKVLDNAQGYALEHTPTPFDRPKEISL